MDEPFMQDSYRRIRAAVRVSRDDAPSTLPSQDQLSVARAALPRATTDADNDPDATKTKSARTWLAGRGAQATVDHLLDDIVPALNGQNRSGRYYGFVTGGTLPVAEVADNLVTAYDQNVQVHLPGQTIATEVEDAALRMLISLLDLGSPETWQGRTFTTGATASNLLGLACGREAVIQARLSGYDDDSSFSVGEHGLLRACAEAGVREIQVLTSMGHSSLSKVASITGLGRGSAKELPHSAAEPWRLDLDAVERELQREGVASIVAISAGEVNTGRFATTGIEDMQRLRELADRYKSWIHIDGAFGIFARALPGSKNGTDSEDVEFAGLRRAAAGLELADSITVDGHKLLNVPYDCGVFLTRKASVLNAVCRNPNAAYLSSGGSADGIQSPLNVGIENSRRFRALPAYAVLLSEGRDGIATMLARMVRLARGIARVIRESPDYVLLPEVEGEETNGTGRGPGINGNGGSGVDLPGEANTHIVVLFRARDDALNDVLVETINRKGVWYVSGTKWKGQSAVRVAVSSWRVDVEKDLEIVTKSLVEMARKHKTEVAVPASGLED